jgi:acetyl esterase/lipase
MSGAAEEDAMRFVAIALALGGTVFAQQGRQEKPAPDVKEEKYGSHERNVFDLWKAKSESPTPLVIFIHGGGFRAGSKEGVSAGLISGCLAKGISVASINYRLSQHAIFPAPFHDSARCVQFLRSKAKEYNLNPERFAATGGSAGAGISLWLAFHDDLADAKSEDPVSRQSTRLTCALGTQAQCSYDPRWIKENVGGRAHEHPALGQLFGVTGDTLTAEKAFKLFEEGSPITHLTKDDVPVMVTYNGSDEPNDKPGGGIHSQKFGQALKKAMEAVGLSCEVKVGRDGGNAVDFFAKHLLK